jgi:hypothetical protein
MVLLPKTIEQQMNARRIEVRAHLEPYALAIVCDSGAFVFFRSAQELGAGVNLGCQAEDITADRLRLAVDRLLDPKVSAAYVEATQRVSRSFEETGGAKVPLDSPTPSS